MKKNKFDKNKVNLLDNIKLERLEAKYDNKQPDFVPELNNWTTISQQKIRVDEIEQKTKPRN